MLRSLPSSVAPRSLSPDGRSGYPARMLLSPERRLREAIEPFSSRDRFNLLCILASSPEARAEAIQCHWVRPESRSFETPDRAGLHHAVVQEQPVIAGLYPATRHPTHHDRSGNPLVHVPEQEV